MECEGSCGPDAGGLRVARHGASQCPQLRVKTATYVKKPASQRRSCGLDLQSAQKNGTYRRRPRYRTVCTISEHTARHPHNDATTRPITKPMSTQCQISNTSTGHSMSNEHSTVHRQRAREPLNDSDRSIGTETHWAAKTPNRLAIRGSLKLSTMKAHK